MIKQTILTFVTLVLTILTPALAVGGELLSPVFKKQLVILAEHELDLTSREPGAYANEVFADNILLALHYLKGDVEERGINWEEIRQPFGVDFVLQPGETFAFHGNVLAEFDPPSGGPAVTMNSKFFIEEGYRSVGGLGGNGVCHLASLINWVASEADLEVTAKVSHDFYPVPGVSRQYGTSIRSQSKTQNLYIQNNFEIPVVFAFSVESGKVDLKVLSWERESNSRPLLTEQQLYH